jgi:glucosamine 6-phosphate synthetase-like amidotransferase/phosphosugar isomerase protein
LSDTSVTNPQAPILLDGLRRLEYRGYDSAGLAIHSPSGIQVVRAVGKLRNLERALEERAAERHGRHRPHALGHARSAQLR